MKTQEIDSLRACFPALDRTRNQRPVAYFDGPGGTQVPRCVVEAMSEYLCCHNANTHSAYAASIETDEIILSARHSFADFFNAAPEEVAFGANMTTLTYHVARALGRRLNRGDEVVITELDHHGNVGPWEALAIERGVGLRVVKVNFLGQGNKGGSSRLPLGEERANILLLACCYQEGSNKHGKTTLSLAPLALSHEDHLKPGRQRRMYKMRS
jgi:selenocysteine lyase/cysteine desulfurase